MYYGAIMKKITLSIVILLLLAGGGFLVYQKDPAQPVEVPTEVPTVPLPSSDVQNLIHVQSPVAGQTITSPLIIKGEARGTWYFEASFPAKLLDAKGNQVAIMPVQADGEWMTEDFVPFETLLYFDLKADQPLTLVLEKDNPSGLPQYDKSISIPLNFKASAGSDASQAACRPSGCSGQVCSDEDRVTTCEYKPEYACYKKAICERQTDGKCGWTSTPEFSACRGVIR